MINDIKTTVMVIVVGILCYKVYIDYKEKKRLHTELLGQIEKYKQITKYVAKLETRYEKSKKLVDKAKKEFKIKDSKIKMLSDATFLMKRHVNKQLGPDYYFETKNKTRSYVYNEIRINGKDSPPIGFVMIKNDGRTYKGNYKFEINIKNLQSVDDESGKIKVYSRAYLILKESGLAKKDRCNGCKDWKDIKYPLDITGGVAYVDPTVESKLKPKFYYWNPKYSISSNLTYSKDGTRFKPGLEVSFLSYGLTKSDSQFKIGVIGTNIGFDVQEWDIYFKPVLYRPFSTLSNTYVGGGVGYGTSGVKYIVGISVGF